MSTMNNGKLNARKAGFERRKAAHASVDQALAHNALRSWLDPHQGKNLAGYMPIRTEIDPLPVMTEMAAVGKVAVPVILGAGMPLEFREWAPGCAMAEGQFGALIPVNGAPLTPEVLIVPLVAYNLQCHRLGYGGGFYDRTLARLRSTGEILAVGFAFEAQLDQEIAIEPTDQRLDCIVTETGPIWPID